jgi:hypothetical protein
MKIYLLSGIGFLFLSTSVLAVEDDLPKQGRSISTAGRIEPYRIAEDQAAKENRTTAARQRTRQIEALMHLDNRAGQGIGITETLEAMTGTNKAIDTVRRLTVGLPKTERTTMQLNLLTDTLKRRNDIYKKLMDRLWDPWRNPAPAVTYEEQLTENYDQIQEIQKSYLAELKKDPQVRASTLGILEGALKDMNMSLERHYENLTLSLK